jgi:hypothetical protein
MLRQASALVYLFTGEFGVDPGTTFYSIALLIVVLIGFVLALIFWNFPVSVAKWFMPKSNDQNYPDINLELENLEIVLYSAIGVYLMAQYLPDLSYDILFAILVGEGDSEFGPVGRSIRESVLEMLYSGSCVFLGFILAIYSGNVKKLIGKVRGRT